jgi:hypothetical protein
MPRIAEVNEEVESEAARTGDALGAMQQIAAPEILQRLCLVVGTPLPDGQVDHLMRIPSKRSLATGRLAMSNLPPDAPLRMVPANLRRVLGLDASEIRLLHSAKR